MSGFNKIVTKLLNESKKTINFTDKEWQFNPPTPQLSNQTLQFFLGYSTEEEEEPN